MPNGTICEFIGGDKDRAADQVLVVPLASKPRPALELLARADELCDGGVSQLVDAEAVRDEVGHLSHTVRSGRYRRVLVVSLGDRAALDPAKIRTAAGAALRWLAAERLSRVSLWIDGLAAGEIDRAAAEWAAGMALAGFKFAEYRNENNGVPRLRVRLCSAIEGHVRRTLPEVGEAVLVVGAVNYTRRLAHQPANVIHPVSLAAEARKLAGAHGLRCTILEPAQLAKLGMNGLLAVGGGAANGPRLIRLDYRAAPRSRTRTVLVGKAVTFDTGGYSIKPAAGLELMKFDKCGGLTVMGVLRAAAALRLKVNLVGVIAAAENAISGDAYRPGDILRMMSGKTVEVTNTDAEGRLVLADALWYAQKSLKPTALIDLATLTGGVRVALGTAAAGLMSNNDELAGQLGEAGRVVHERLWRLPLWDDYRDLIRGTDSDIKNSPGKRDAHAIVGGMFLKEFIQDGVPWAHLDIAAVATNDEGENKGATGFGVRLLVEFLKRQTA